jgi:hypothetical protein
VVTTVLAKDKETFWALAQWNVAQAAMKIVVAIDFKTR